MNGPKRNTGGGEPMTSHKEKIRLRVARESAWKAFDDAKIDYYEATILKKLLRMISNNHLIRSCASVTLADRSPGSKPPAIR